MAEKTEKLDFEKALGNLEQVVEAIESGNLTLEQALKQYEDGVRLIRLCQGKLTDAEKKIEILTRDLDGSLKKEVFDPETVGREAPKGKKKKTAATEEPVEAEDY